MTTKEKVEIAINVLEEMRLINFDKRVSKVNLSNLNRQKINEALVILR